MQTKTNPTLNIDWAMLREQKKQLIELQANPTITIHQVAALEGMVQMIDAIQDNAVDNEEVPANSVSLFSEDETCTHCGRDLEGVCEADDCPTNSAWTGEHWNFQY